MSTKTVTKRIALATVVALGAGVLSLVSVTSASALDNKKMTDNANQAANIGTMNIATVNNTVAAGVLPLATSAQSGGAASFGLVTVGDIAGNNTATTTQVATLLANGTLTVYSFNGGSTSATPFDAIVVSGATIQTAGNSGTGVTPYINAGQTAVVESPTAGAAASAWGATIKPNAGVSSFTVSYYESNTASATSATTALASPTSGTLVGFITVSVATASVSGVVSQTKSGIFYTSGAGGITSGTTFAGVTADTTTGTPGTSSYSVVQTADIRVRDAYSVGVNYGLTGSSMGVMTAVATNGAYVNLIAPASSGGNVTVAATAGSTTSAYASAGDNTYMVVSNPGTSALSTTVTVSWNGVVVGTKSFTFTGKISKVTLSGFRSATTNAAPATIADPLKGAYGSAAFYDAAGNQVYPTSTDAAYPSSGISKDALIGGIAGLGIAYKAVSATSTGTTVIYNCGNVNAVGTMAIDYTNPDGSAVASNIVPASCSGKAATYSAKLDKTTYKSGDIAKLTVTFKDSVGALASDETNTIAATGLVPVFAGTAMTPTTSPAATDASTNSVITYTFIVGQPTSDGTFALNVDFPAVDAVSGAAQQVAYTIANGGTSLNDVLKGIVSLIASINKQIAALAKLVAKK